jgi:hypothetical protein
MQKNKVDLINYIVEYLKPFFILWLPTVLGRAMHYAGVEKRMPGFKEILAQAILCAGLAIVAMGVSSLLNIHDEYIMNLIGVIVGVSGMRTFSLIAEMLKKRFGIDIGAVSCDIDLEKKKDD